MNKLDVPMMGVIYRLMLKVVPEQEQIALFEKYKFKNEPHYVLSDGGRWALWYKNFQDFNMMFENGATKEELTEMLKYMYVCFCSEKCDYPSCKRDLNIKQLVLKYQK